MAPSARAWIFTVAKRILIDQVEPALDAAEVRAALASLPERLRITHVENYFQERSVAEAAEVLDVPTGHDEITYFLRATGPARGVGRTRIRHS